MVEVAVERGRGEQLRGHHQRRPRDTRTQTKTSLEDVNLLGNALRMIRKEIPMKGILRRFKQAAPTRPTAPLSTVAFCHLLPVIECLIPCTAQAARLANSDLYIRVRIGSEHAEVLVLTLTAKTLTAVAEASTPEDPSLSPPLVVRFNGATLTSDGQLAHCLPRVSMDLDQALVLVSAEPPPLPDLIEPEQTQTSDSRSTGPVPAAAHETAIAPHQVMISYNWGVKTAAGKYDMQELVKCIAAELKSSNLSVWMDVERGVDSVPLMNGVIHDNVHMVTLPLVQARLASIFSSCQASLDFRSHADWDSQIAVLKAEIIAKLNSAPQDVVLSPGSQTAPVESDVATAASSIILPAAVPTTPLPSVTRASSDPAVSDVAVPASISNAAAADTTAASSTPIVAGCTSVDFYMKRELEDWLNPVSFESDMASYASQYVEGTRDWAVDAIGTQFTGDANVVWLNGAAGVGKSLVAYLAAASPPSGFTLLSAFFCKHYDEKKNNAAATRYLIVIDALDECGTQGDPTRNGLLSLLASLNTGSSNAAAKLPPFVKILTTGRPEADIWKVMESLRTDSLEPTAEQHECWTNECCRLLTENSEFVFVAARVLCSQLRSIVDSHHGVDGLDLVAVVQHLSASLDDQYARILESNIKTDNATDLDVYMKFMYVLLAAKVPLDCANIAVLTDLSAAGVQLVISKLHSLLLVSPDGKVTVLHKSVKDFLTSPARCTIPAFYVSLVKANVFVAQRCLAVLNNQLHHNMFGLSSASEAVQLKQQEILSTLSPAVRYSCLHWTTHILNAADLNGDKLWCVLSVLSEFCTKKILQWLEVMAVEKKLSQLMESCTALVKMMESVSGPKTIDAQALSLGLAGELLSDIARLIA
ncbi:POC1 centriolar protein A, partial [Entophlyctis luteolus]